MKKSINRLFLQFLCIHLFCSLGVASAASDMVEEWMNPGSREVVLGLVKHMVTNLNGFELNALGSHPHILQGGRQTAYAKDHEVALRALARKYAPAVEGVTFADMGCGVGTMGLLIPFIADGSKPIEIVLVEACSPYFGVFDESFKRISSIYPKSVTFRKVTRMLEELKGTFAGGTFDGITCMNVLHLMSDAKQLKAIRDMGSLLKDNGIIVASCVACNAGILTEGIAPTAGRYMAKVTIDVEKGVVDNTIKEFISLGEVGVTDYTPQAYYVLEGDVYTKKSCGELLTLGEAGRTECYRYVHHFDEHEFKRMFSNSDSGFYVEHFCRYTFCDASETSLLTGLGSTGERPMNGAEGFCVVARKIPT